MRRCVIGRQTRQLRSVRRLVKIAAALVVAGRSGRGPPAARFMFYAAARPSQRKSKLASAMERLRRCWRGGRGWETTIVWSPDNLTRPILPLGSSREVRLADGGDF